MQVHLGLLKSDHGPFLQLAGGSHRTKDHNRKNLNDTLTNIDPTNARTVWSARQLQSELIVLIKNVKKLPEHLFEYVLRQRQQKRLGGPGVVCELRRRLRACATEPNGLPLIGCASLRACADGP